MPSEITPYFSFPKEQSCQERRVFRILLVLMNWRKRSLTIYTAPIMVERHARVPIEGCRLCLLARDECRNQDLWSQLWFKSREIPQYSTGDLCWAKVILCVMSRKKEKRGKPHGRSARQMRKAFMHYFFFLTGKSFRLNQTLFSIIWNTNMMEKQAEYVS